MLQFVGPVTPVRDKEHESLSSCNWFANLDAISQIVELVTSKARALAHCPEADSTRTCTVITRVNLLQQ